MNVLVACEFSGIVRDAFRARGHNAFSCDLEPCERDSRYHLRGDVFQYLDRHWDLLIAHPPCTYLCNSGVAHLHGDAARVTLMKEAIEFFLRLYNSDIPKIAVENPTMHKYARCRINLPKPQIIQPYQFGHTESKRTCLWLKGLPALIETNNVYDQMMKLPIRERQPLWWGGSRNKKSRSRTFTGIAQAMAEQWG